MATVEQSDLTLILYGTQLIRGFSNDTTTIDYWQIDKPIKVVPKEKGTESEERDNYLHILDWLAQFLVSQPHGDVIAVATRLMTGTSPTLYISNNPCSEDKTNLKKLGTSLQSLVNNFFKEYKAQKLKTDEAIERESNIFLKEICKNSWKVVLSKMKRIQSSINGLEGTFPDNLRRIYKVWKEKTKDPAVKAIEADYLALAKKKYGENADVIQPLLGHWQMIIKPVNMRVDSPKSRLLTLKTWIYHCTEFFSSPILSQIAEQRQRGALVGLAKEDLAFLGRLYRRLKKFIKFWSGALEFLKDGLDKFSKLWDTNEEKIKGSAFSLKVVYVFESRNFNSFNLKLISFTNDKALKTISDIKNDALKDIVNKDKAILDQLDEQVKGITCGGFKCEARFHCETTLALFLIMSEISADHNAIGVSKLMCWSCTKFFEELKARTNKSFYLSGSSGKSHHAWRYPTANLFTHASGLKDFATQFDEAGQSVGLLAKNELKRVFRSFFPDTPPGSSGAAIPKPPFPPGPSGPAIPSNRSYAAAASGQQKGLTAAKGSVLPGKKTTVAQHEEVSSRGEPSPQPKGTSSKVAPSLQQEGPGTGVAPLSQQKVTSSGVSPSSQQKGTSVGASSSSQGVQGAAGRKVDPGSDSSEGAVSIKALNILKKVKLEDNQRDARNT